MTMAIYLKGLNGKLHTLDVEPETDIGTIKNRLVQLIDKEDSSPFAFSNVKDRISLIFAGKTLYDENTIASLNIRQGACIHYVQRPSGIYNSENIINKIALNLVRRKGFILDQDERALIENKDADINDYMNFACKYPDSIIADDLLKEDVIVRKPGYEAKERSIKHLADSQKASFPNTSRKINYTWEKAFLWGNFMEHCKQASEGTWNQRAVHVVIAAFEFLPIFSQIFSIFEKLIVDNLQDIGIVKG